MCLACEEMDVYFAYLEQQEAKKRATAQSAPSVKLSAESSDSERPIIAAQSQFSCEDPTGQ